MKTNRISKLARLTGMTVALALFASIGGLANAQEKGAERLLRLGGKLVEPKSAPSDYKPMSCAKCVETLVKVSDLDSRGLGARGLMTRGSGLPTKLVAKHLCDGCGVEWRVEGIGKAKHDVTTHKCTSCGSESLACCSTKKGSETATKGMEKNFEIAPLK